MFCEDCVNKNLESRNRQCPLDKQKFGKNDIRKIYWNVGDDN